MEEFQSPVSVKQCYNCQSFGHSDKTCRSKQICLICGENHSHKGCPNRSREARKPKCANCKWPHVASYKACPEYKEQAFRQHVVKTKKTYASTVSQNTLPQPRTTIRHLLSQPYSSPNSWQIWLYKSPNHRFATQIQRETR